MAGLRTMEIYPAIDLRGGCCVRLQQGDYRRETVFDTDPVSVAHRWVERGANWIHIVDLDGAKQGRPVHQSLIAQIVREVPAHYQVGGGLRELSDIESVLHGGVSRVLIGTRGIQEPEWLQEVCRSFPNRVVLSLDAHGMRLATHGWQQESDWLVVDLMNRFSDLPLAGFVYTDIRRDGMLNGPNIEALSSLRASCSLPLIASGGVSSLEDVQQLAQLGLDGCIIGRALYDGAIDLSEAIRVSRRSPTKSAT